MVAKTPRLLTPQQRDHLTRVPADLSARELGRYYTFSPHDLDVISRHRRPANRLGFAVQLGLLRFPGRSLPDVPEVPERVLAYIAEQVGVDPAVFPDYGQRENTLYEHLDELRREFGYRTCGWQDLRALGRGLVPLAQESDGPLPLVETAVSRLRTDQIIAPGITTIERVVWIVQRLAQRRAASNGCCFGRSRRRTGDDSTHCCTWTPTYAPAPGSAGSGKRQKLPQPRVCVRCSTA